MFLEIDVYIYIITLTQSQKTSNLTPAPLVRRSRGTKDDAVASSSLHLKLLQNKKFVILLIYLYLTAGPKHRLLLLPTWLQQELAWRRRRRAAVGEESLQSQAHPASSPGQISIEMATACVMCLKPFRRNLKFRHRASIR